MDLIDTWLGGVLKMKRDGGVEWESNGTERKEAGEETKKRVRGKKGVKGMDASRVSYLEGK